MLNVGLTGGIGAGKSAVLARFAELGAVVIDADELARTVVEPGTIGYRDVVAAFGPPVVGADGRLDRPALARLVFADAAARARLEGIIHPLVRAAARDIVEQAPVDAVVVNDVPLLVETGRAGDYDVVVVVEAPADLRLRRLADSRGMTVEEAQARLAAQADDDQRRAVAWRVIVNDGTREELREKVDDVWRALRERAGRPG